MDKAKVVEYIYLGAWILLLLCAAGLAWATAARHQRVYRGLVPVFGVITFAAIVVGVAISNQFYPKK